MLKTRFSSMMVAAFAALALSACGGGGELGDGGTTGGTLGGTAGGTTGTNPTPARLTLLASSPQLNSDALAPEDGVTLTAIVRDANNNVMPGVTVVFSTQDEALIGPPVGGSQITPTDPNGRTAATLTTGGEQQNRPVRVKATAGSLSSEITVQVVGTNLSISGPSNTQFDAPTEYTILLVDAAGKGISGQPVTLATEPENTVSASRVDTDSAGQVRANLTVAREESSLTASALGLSARQVITASPDRFSIISPAANTETQIGTLRDVTVRWTQDGVAVPNGTQINFAATRGTFPGGSSATTANGEATVRIRSNEAGLSTVTASSPALSRPSANLSLEFVAVTPARIDIQANPSTVPLDQQQASEISAVVRDANNNLVKNVTVEFSLVDQTGGTLSSPTAVTNSQGLARISYSSSSQTSATEGVRVTARVRNTNIADVALLTVGGRALGITLGTGSEVIVKDESTYQMTYTVVVADAAGNPVPNADFRLTLSPVAYYEGYFPDLGGITARCVNEDLNRNGILDPGEDTNGNNRLDPGPVAALPPTVALDSDGAGQFLVTYAKDYGFFVEVEITGTARVAGSETTVKRRFVLPVAEDDVDNLPGVSPFGIDGRCETWDPLGVLP